MSGEDFEPACPRYPDWNAIFRDAHLHSWPTASLCVANFKPPHPTARNVYQEDKGKIHEAAARHGYRLISLGHLAHFLNSNRRGVLC